jgi:hypothetical protein
VRCNEEKTIQTVFRYLPSLSYRIVSYREVGRVVPHIYAATGERSERIERVERGSSEHAGRRRARGSVDGDGDARGRRYNDSGNIN